jgi:phage terminase large subunit
MLGGEACVVMRATQTSIKKTIMNDFRDVISGCGLSDYFTIHKSSPMRITSKIGTGEVLFLGADKSADDSKGIKPSNGAGKFTVVFVDEADQVPKAAIMQLRIRIRGISNVEGTETNFIYSFNPTFLQHYLFQDFIIPTGFDPYTDYRHENEDTLIARMTYRDNAFLADSDIEELNNLGKQSTYFKQVYLDAEPGVLGKRCIEQFETISADQVPLGLNNWLGGVDHGYNDPMACVWGKFDERNKILYITDELYGSEMNLDIVATVLPDTVTFTGDSEDPRSNAYLRTKGLRVADAVKGPGSVFAGIMFLNTCTIKVVDSCVQTIIALQNYSWEIDKLSDAPTDKPSHAFSHGVDAIRYMIERYSRSMSGIKGTSFKR